MDAWSHRTAGIFGGDPPKMAEAERERLRALEWSVVEVVVIVVQELQKGFVIAAAKELEESGTSLREIYTPDRLIVPESLGG